MRRNYNYNELLGDSNNAITPALELAHAQNEGITSGIKTGAQIRGILNFSQLLSPEKLKVEKERFMEDYLSIANSGGVVATDQKAEFKPITANPVSVDEKQLQAAKLKSFYAGKQWKRTQAAYMVSQYYVCERCGGAARVVHHRKYITPQNINDIDITLNWSNLEALCMDCHNAEHGAGAVCAEGLGLDEYGNLVVIDPV